MKHNRFQDFDRIILDRAQLLEDYKDKYQELASSASQKIETVYFGKSNLYLGHFCPSLIIDKIFRNFRKEKLRTKIPKSEEFVTYEVDRSGKIVKTSECLDGNPVFETFIIGDDKTRLSINYFNKKTVSTDSIRAVYSENRITRFDIIGTSYIMSEVYNYITESEILCDYFHYVPNLVNSDRSAEAGKPNSPMIHNKYKILVDGQGNKNVILDS